MDAGDIHASAAAPKNSEADDSKTDQTRTAPQLLGRYETLYKKNKAKADEEMKAYKNSEADLNVSSDDEDAKVAKGKKKKKAHKFPDAPKPALTPNILFSQAERENVRIAQ
jgi:hypothetical protein